MPFHDFYKEAKLEPDKPCWGGKSVTKVPFLVLSDKSFFCSDDLSGQAGSSWRMWSFISLPIPFFFFFWFVQLQEMENSDYDRDAPPMKFLSMLCMSRDKTFKGFVETTDISVGEDLEVRTSLFLQGTAM